MKVIVTGGAGYIGSHTSVKLLESGYEVVIVDNLSNSSRDVLDRIHQIANRQPLFEELDLCDLVATRALFEKHSDIKGVIHFAALKAVGDSVKWPTKYYRNNLLSMLNLLECMNTYHVDNLIFSSSCTVYGQPKKLPVTEETPILPAEAPYGNSKQINEEMIRDAIIANELSNAISLRYFNPVGAHSSALIGELPLGVPTNLMPYITQTVIGLRTRLSVFGSDYNTPDGTPIRDYIHVIDLAEAHLVALERLINKKNLQPLEYFNLGTGEGSSVLEVINSFERSTGIKVPYEIVGRRPGDIEQIYADTTKAKLELGWETKLSLDEMTASAWAWEKNLREVILKK